MALINVVIPVYNAISYLKETVYSVLNQPYKGIDIVLVDDGSTDGSGQLCDELAAEEDRIHVIHQNNSGVSTARNAGIDYILRLPPPHYVSFDYIAFLDADDLWVPNAITEERASHIFATAPDVVGFSLYCSNNNITRFQSLSHYEEKLLIFSQQYQTDFLWAQGSFAAHFYRVELLARNSLYFDPSCRLNEDVIFSAKALFCSVRILLLDAYLYVYRRNPQSVTSTFHYSLHNAAEIPNAWVSAANFFDNHPEITPEGLQKWHRFC